MTQPSGRKPRWPIGQAESRQWPRPVDNQTMSQPSYCGRRLTDSQPVRNPQPSVYWRMTNWQTDTAQLLLDPAQASWPSEAHSPVLTDGQLLVVTLVIDPSPAQLLDDSSDSQWPSDGPDWPSDDWPRPSPAQYWLTQWQYWQPNDHWPIDPMTVIGYYCWHWPSYWRTQWRTAQLTRWPRRWCYCVTQ